MSNNRAAQGVTVSGKAICGTCLADDWIRGQDRGVKWTVSGKNQDLADEEDKMADKRFEETVFSRIMKVCSEISGALEKDEFQVLDGLFVKREELNNLTPAMSKSEIEEVFAFDREIIGGLEIKRALTGTGISEVRRAKKALQTLKMRRSGPSGRRRMAVSA